jgi:predicted MFS family arabinose efflux permease
MFYRVSNAVIAPNLIKDLSLSTEMLGVLGGALFYSFALLQIPMGIMLDRIGPRLVLAVFSLIGASGAFIFAGSHTIGMALLGRVLIGVGTASILMGSLKVFVLRFSPQHFATLSTILVSVGTLGSVLASSPLAYMAMTIGWRMTFVLVGAVTALFGCLALWVLSDGQSRQKSVHVPHKPDEDMALSKIVKLVLCKLSFWQIGIFSFFRYGTFISLQGLWLGPYLMGVKGFSALQAGNILMNLSIGFIAGSPFSGFLADRVFRSSKVTTMCGVGCYAITLIPLTGLAEIQSPLVFSVLFFIIGFFNSFGTLAFSHVKELFPLRMSGTVIAGVNFFSMAGAAVLMPLMGKVIEAFTPLNTTNSPKAFHLAFLICFVGMTASLISYFFSKDVKRRN